MHSNDQDEIGELVRAMDRMRSNLQQVVGAVRGNAESVATASSQISQGNHDLSQRTEEQASALQQAAASMDELGSTVRTTADSAQQANRLALGAADVATRGGSVVGEVITTMKAINDRAKKMTDIIGTIDGIAFQTNILALHGTALGGGRGRAGCSTWPDQIALAHIVERLRRRQSTGGGLHPAVVRHRQASLRSDDDDLILSLGIILSGSISGPDIVRPTLSNTAELKCPPRRSRASARSFFSSFSCG